MPLVAAYKVHLSYQGQNYLYIVKRPMTLAWLGFIDKYEHQRGNAAAYIMGITLMTRG